jgi:Swt1-like HEPN
MTLPPPTHCRSLRRRQRRPSAWLPAPTTPSWPAFAAADANRYLLPPEHDLIGFAQHAARDDLLTAAGLTSVSLSNLMAGMHQPWLEAGHAERSIAGFTQLQLMSGLLQQHEPYGRDVTAAFRDNLGDFRSPVDMLPTAYIVPAVRDDLYIARGFNPDLTNFTPAAFREITAKAGFEDGGDEEDFQHNEAAYGRLLRFEVRFRRFIVGQMLREYGEKWMVQCLPKEMQDKWNGKRNESIKKGAPDGEPIDFSDIGDYIAIIERRNHWEACFKPVFRRLDSVRESLIRLFPIRNATAHSRIITLKDATLILYETSRILDAIHPFQE